MDYDPMYPQDHPFYYDPKIDREKIQKKVDEDLAEATVRCIKMLVALLITAFLLLIITFLFRR